MVEYIGTGDPKRSMELLWGINAAPTRGPKPGLTVAAIVDAAIEVADADGLGALSMRRVADRLGKSAMALYTYVPGKAELLELMLDTALGELPTEYSVADGWRPAVEASARAGWDFFQRHPWVLQVSGSRALLGPHELDLYEAQMRLVDGLGLSGTDMSRIVSVVYGYVRGAAKAMVDAATAEQNTGISDDDWWNARSPLLEELITSERYPTLSRLDAEHSFDPSQLAPDDALPYTVQVELDAFEFGLQRLLDGIETYIDASPAICVSQTTGLESIP